MSTLETIAQALRHAADRYDGLSCEEQILFLFDEVDKHKALTVVLELLKQYQPVFAHFHDDIIWIPEVLNLLQAKASPERIKPLMRWEEFEKWDQNAYFSSVESLCWAYFRLQDEDYYKARENLLSSLQAIMNAHRYNFWSSRYPHLELFWGAGDDLDSTLARLSCARDPIVPTVPEWMQQLRPKV